MNKGQQCGVLSCAHDTETHEESVVSRALRTFHATDITAYLKSGSKFEVA
jgi:hypothetical protein